MAATFCLLPSTVTSADDSYIAGYATAILEQEFLLTDVSLRVQNGVVTVGAQSLGSIDPGKVIAALEHIPGVVRVGVQEGGNQLDGRTPQNQDAVTAEIPKPESKFLPRGLLFTPLHADPRWPHFSAAYRYYRDRSDFSSIFAANFGESFALYRNAAFGGEWELGIQAGVFSIFDVATQSIDLVNADYTVGLLSSYRSGKFSGFLRLRHQRSHPGDEFLLNNPTVNRINLSFEEVDMKLSYDLFSWLRVYGGGGYLSIDTPMI